MRLFESDEEASTDEGAFSRFLEATEPSLRRALMAAYGFEAGREATAEALAWAWEHQDRLAGLEYPVAFLYRVAQSRSNPSRAGPRSSAHRFGGGPSGRQQHRYRQRH